MLQVFRKHNITRKLFFSYKLVDVNWKFGYLEREVFDIQYTLPSGDSLLRHCATSRKVAGSIPDGVIRIFH